MYDNRAIRIAAPLPVGALILAVCGIILCGLGSIQRTGKTVIAAIMYILAGLCLAVGVVLFISAIYDELGYHSQAAESREFSYYYGWSFYVAGSAFVSSELAAVLCVTLYLRHHARVRDIVRIIPGLEEKLEEEEEKERGERERERERGERVMDRLRVEEEEEDIRKERNCVRLGVC